MIFVMAKGDAAWRSLGLCVAKRHERCILWKLDCLARGKLQNLGPHCVWHDGQCADLALRIIHAVQQECLYARGKLRRHGCRDQTRIRVDSYRKILRWTGV